MDGGGGKDWIEWILPGPPRLRYTATDIARWLEFDVKTLCRMIESGHFPRGHKDSPRSEETWTGADLAAWLHLRGRWAPQPNPGEAPQEDTGGHRGTPRDTGGHRRKSDEDVK